MTFGCLHLNQNPNILTYFREVGQKYRNIFVRFLVQMKTSKSFWNYPTFIKTSGKNDRCNFLNRVHFPLSRKKNQWKHVWHWKLWRLWQINNYCALPIIVEHHIVMSLGKISVPEHQIVTGSQSIATADFFFCYIHSTSTFKNFSATSTSNGSFIEWSFSS